MKNKEVQQFQMGLNQVAKFLGPRFVGAVSRNKIRVKFYLQARDEEANHLEGVDIIEYRKISKRINDARIPICIKHSRKDEKGNPIMKGNPPQQFYDIEDMEAFNAECDETLGLDQAVLKEMDEIRGEFIKEWNEKEATLDVFMIDEEVLPTDINSTEIEGIIWMVRELVEELKGSYNSGMKKETPTKKLKKK